MEPAMWPGDLAARLAEIADRADFSILDPDLLIRMHRTRRRRRIVLSSAALALTLAGSATALLIAQTGDGRDKLTPVTSGATPAPTTSLSASPALSGYKARLAVIAGEYAKSQGVGVASAKAVMTNCRGAAAKTCLQVTGTDISGPPHIWLMAIVTDRVFTCRSCKGMGFQPSSNIAVALDADTWKDLGSGIGGRIAIDIAAVGEPVQIVG